MKTRAKPGTSSADSPDRDDLSSRDGAVTVVMRLVNHSFFSLRVLCTWKQTRTYVPYTSYSIKAPFCCLSPLDRLLSVLLAQKCHLLSMKAHGPKHAALRAMPVKVCVTNGERTAPKNDLLCTGCAESWLAGCSP